MNFAKRTFSRSSTNSTTPTTPSATERKFSASEDPEWKAVLEIKDECVKAWIIPDRGAQIAVKPEKVGFFMSDEMYAVLQVANHNKKLVYNLHFWIGLDKAKRMATNVPEKVAELMALLDDKVVLHRQVSGSEDPAFKKLFKVFGVLSGNTSNMFDTDHPDSYAPRLLHFALNKTKTRTEVIEVPISKKSLLSCDVYIYDEGTRMTQWNGSRCDEEERIQGRKYIEVALKDRKTKCTSEFYDEEDLLPVNEFCSKLGQKDVPARPMKLSKKQFKKKLLRLSDATKKLVLTEVYSGKVFRAGINTDDVTFVDTLQVLFVYIGPGANENERNSVWSQSEKYLSTAGTPSKSVAVFNAGCFCEGYEELWDDART